MVTSVYITVQRVNTSVPSLRFSTSLKQEHYGTATSPTSWYTCSVQFGVAAHLSVDMIGRLAVAGGCVDRCCVRGATRPARA
eukprot:5420674-Prymnesium_polylepis.1